MFERSSPGTDLAVGLVVLLLVVNLLAISGMVQARRDARAAIREGQILETRADSRTVEALLAQLYADLEFLAQSPPFADASPATGEDPVARRWARLDVEATLLRFLQTRPAVVGLRAGDVDSAWAVAERVDGVPALGRPEREPEIDPGLLHATIPLGRDDAWLEARIDPRPVLATVGPDLRLHRSPPTAPSGPVEPLRSGLWTPALEGWIEGGERDAGVAGAVDRLASRYRTTLVLNIALLPVSLMLVVLTLRRVQRLARLESEREQAERLRALERQVRHAERLSSLGRFAAGIAHEIANPLEGMANYLQLVRDDLEAGRVDDARAWLPRLDEGIERAAGTVRQVLDFAEPGRGARDTLDLRAVVERAVVFARGHPDCRDVAIRVEGPSELPILGDSVTLGQLALNLLLNACQAQEPSPEGAGEVEVRLHVEGPVEGSVENEVGDAARAVIRVRDRGPGFPPEIAANPFEPFRSTRGSTGLGLVVCHGIVTEHGGEISVGAREDGPGAEVVVRLPRAREAAP